MMIYKPYSLIYIDKGIFSEGYTCSTTWKLIVTLSFLCYMNRKNKLYFDHLMPIFLEWIDILYQVKCFVWQLPSDLNSDHQLITEILGQPMEQGIISFRCKSLKGNFFLKKLTEEIINKQVYFFISTRIKVIYFMVNRLLTSYFWYIWHLEIENIHPCTLIWTPLCVFH